MESLRFSISGVTADVQFSVYALDQIESVIVAWGSMRIALKLGRRVFM